VISQPISVVCCVRHTLSAIACLLAFNGIAHAQPRARVAVLAFGDSITGVRAANEIRKGLAGETSAAKGISLVDQSLATAAARGNGFQGSLKLTTQEARDLGAAIGCDFFVIGDADTMRRSPSTGPAYFESYASIFIVSARTGRLILWERPLERKDIAEEAEQSLIEKLASEVHHKYQAAILRALEDESAERAAAVETPAATIEIMSDDKDSADARAPRPYRHLKPSYPDSAAVAEVEATVDVLVDIDARGEIAHVEIARWAGYGLDQSVINTVKQMHFFPAMRDGVAIPMRVLLRYNFRKTQK
jgi:TonB family protein